MPKKKSPAKGNKKNRQKKKTFNFAYTSIAVLSLFFIFYLVYLNVQVTSKIEEGHWSLPSRVYARPLKVSVGHKLKLNELIQELDALGYRKNNLSTEGSYQSYKGSIRINRRKFKFPTFLQNAAIFDLNFNQNYITQIKAENGQEIDQFTLDPVLISSFYASNGEDRLILDYEQIPKSLINTLIAVEDRQFYQHFGINPSAIIRALWVNIKAGKTVQGGSTLTQQLAKNFYLNANKNLWRKMNEALYALLIEWHMNKQQIITAYINQVFLSQQKKLAIHGFALASEVLFRQPLSKISLDKQALLVAMIKGPSYYNPVRHPKRAIKRRNLILGVMFEQRLIAKEQLTSLKAKPLGLQLNSNRTKSYPAFIDLVKKQLPSQYQSQQLKKSGLRIFTTLDPIVQSKSNQAVSKNLVLKANHNLQTAAVIANHSNGDILAVIGDRKIDYSGFNRALLAQRSIGSLIKPLVLYSLIEQGESLATQVEDRPITLKQSDGQLWSPQNYDSTLHGKVSLYQALVYSYNLPFVRIGLEKGLEPLVKTLEKFGLQKNSVIYPSLLLGVLELTPLEVTQIYQTIANNGIYVPLSGIRYVTDKDNNILTRRPVQSVQLLNPESIEQVKSALIGVAQKGTARSLKSKFPELKLAGKTGTTDDYHDSWFAGFSEHLVGIVWMGSDKNEPIGLTGSSGALRLWSDLFINLPIRSIQKNSSSEIQWVSVDPSGGYLMDASCEVSQLLPYKTDDIPQDELECDDGVLKKASKWFKNLLNRDN